MDDGKKLVMGYQTTVAGKEYIKRQSLINHGECQHPFWWHTSFQGKINPPEATEADALQQILICCDKEPLTRGQLLTCFTNMLPSALPYCHFYAVRHMEYCLEKLIKYECLVVTEIPYVAQDQSYWDVQSTAEYMRDLGPDFEYYFQEDDVNYYLRHVTYTNKAVVDPLQSKLSDFYVKKREIRKCRLKSKYGIQSSYPLKRRVLAHSPSKI